MHRSRKCSGGRGGWWGRLFNGCRASDLQDEKSSGHLLHNNVNSLKHRQEGVCGESLGLFFKISQGNQVRGQASAPLAGERLYAEHFPKTFTFPTSASTCQSPRPVSPPPPQPPSSTQLPCDLSKSQIRSSKSCDKTIAWPPVVLCTKKWKKRHSLPSRVREPVASMERDDRKAVEPWHRSGPGHGGCRGAESNSAVGRGGREASQSRRHCTGPRMLGRCLSRAGAQWEGLQAEGQLGKGGDAPTPGEGSGEAGRRGAE